MITKRELNKRDFAEFLRPARIPSAKQTAKHLYCTATRWEEDGGEYLALGLWHTGGQELMCWGVFDRDNMQAHVRELGYLQFNMHRTGTFVPLKKPRWTATSLAHIAKPAYEYYGKLVRDVACSKDTAALLTEYFGNNRGAGLAAVDRFQTEIRDIATEKRRQKRKVDVAGVMDKFPPLPGGWSSFVEKVFKYSRYIFYEKSKEGVTGVCGCCGSYVKLDEAKYNAKAVCPCCKTTVILKSKNRAKNVRDIEYLDFVFTTEEGGVGIRTFIHRRGWNQEHDYVASIYEREVRRYYKAPGEDWVLYDLDPYSLGAWRKTNKDNIYANVVYPDNLKAVLAAVGTPYSGADILAAKGTAFSFIGWQIMYNRYNCVEYFPKIGLNQISCTISLIHTDLLRYTDIHLDGKGLPDILPYEKSEIQYFAEIDAGVYDISTYRKYKKAGYQFSRERLEWFRRKRLNPDWVLDIAQDNKGHVQVNPFRLAKYLLKQKGQGRSLKGIRTLWDDYLEVAQHLGFPLDREYYLFPKDLVKRHNELEVQTRMGKVSKSVANGFLRRASEYRYLRYENSQYIIRAPITVDEIIYEGMMLDICVGNPIHSYMKAHSSGTKALFLLHKKTAPKKPYCVFEVSAKGVVGQVSCYDNRAAAAAARSFIAEWAKVVAQPFFKAKERKKQVELPAKEAKAV